MASENSNKEGLGKVEEVEEVEKELLKYFADIDLSRFTESALLAYLKMRISENEGSCDVRIQKKLQNVAKIHNAKLSDIEHKEPFSESMRQYIISFDIDKIDVSIINLDISISGI